MPTIYYVIPSVLDLTLRDAGHLYILFALYSLAPKLWSSKSEVMIRVCTA